MNGSQTDTGAHFHKIEVKGKIHLGYRHELLQVTRQDLTDGQYVARGHGYQAVDSDPAKYRKEQGIGSVLDFKISDKPIDDLFIEDSGLVTSYGIFGAPGSGKTVLLMYLLEQVLKHAPDEPSKRYGALILDPKAALINDIKSIAADAGRSEDLIIINTDLMNAAPKGDTKYNAKPINIIDCTLDPYELGAILVLAGRSAGIDASDPFRFQEWTNLFASSLSILRAYEKFRVGHLGPKFPAVSLRGLLNSIAERSIKTKAEFLRKNLSNIPEKDREDILIDIGQLNRFFSQKYVGTVEAFITKAFGMFRRSRLACYSDDSSRVGFPFYEDIIERGRIVVVSVSPSEPVLAKTLCTLVKCLFQRTVLSRGESKIRNKERPVVLACDEYSEIASEVAGQSMGDGQFLALARQYGCMALLATQSVNVLSASSLKETWRSVFSNFAAKIYMRLVDNETAEEATKLAGESDWRVMSQGQQFGGARSQWNEQQQLLGRKNLPPVILTQILKRGQGVVIGSLDGGTTTPGTFVVSVPFRVPQEAAILKK
ncbi:MAG: type IV secretion system DNA-binding domain-containing protein [Nitrosomonas sp.]|nr:type IV secretion system DNA-binding domain-containing protein [Nitrosomonas sp.]